MRAQTILQRFAPLAAVVVIVTSSLIPAAAQETSRAEAEFYKAYYLQHERKDLKKAVEAYKRSIALDANAATRAAVDAQMAGIQEELATSDFAQIMPSDAFAYVELSNPADHLEQVARLMGLTGRKPQAGRDVAVLRIEDEFAISSDFQISPALLRELKKIRGAAVAVSDIGSNGKPVAVAVIHPGDSDLVTGIVETGIQLVPATEKIEGYPTFQIENEAWFVKANRVILISTSKSEISKCLKRIKNAGSDSLANQTSFQSARDTNGSPALFAYVNPREALRKFGGKIDQELAIARMVLDLDHVNHITAKLTSTDQGLQAKVAVEFAEDHHSFGYGLIRTVPLSGKALAHVPSGTVAVVGMGLNPKMMMAAEVAGSKHLTALDIGREIFANIGEVGMFVMPSASDGQEVPDFGLIVASSDVDKSQTLWNTLLSLPTEMEIEDGPRAKTIEIDGVEARHYAFPDKEMPQLIIARLSEETLIAGTESAVRSAIRARKTGKTLAKDPKAKSLWQAKSKHTAKAAFIHVGRALRLAAAMEGGRSASEMRAISQVIDDLTITLVVDEEPAYFSAQLDATGLPKFEDVIKTLSGNQPQRSPSDAAVSVSVKSND